MWLWEMLLLLAMLYSQVLRFLLIINKMIILQYGGAALIFLVYRTYVGKKDHVYWLNSSWKKLMAGAAGTVKRVTHSLEY